MSSLELSILFFLSGVLCFFFHKYVSIKVLFFGRSWITASVSPSVLVNWLLVKLRTYVFVSSFSWVVLQAPKSTKSGGTQWQADLLIDNAQIWPSA